MSAGAFVADLFRYDTLAYGIISSPLIATAVAGDTDMVITSVTDTSKGLRPEVTEELQEDSPQTDGRAWPPTGGTGLELSERLVRAMNGRLTA